MAFTYDFPRPMVTVDSAIFSPDRFVILIRRGKDPYKGKLALPGGFFDPDNDKSLLEAAYRELKEETGVSVRHLELLNVYDAPGRDPRGRVINVTFFGIAERKKKKPKAGDDATTAAWWPIGALESSGMAFDHGDILRHARQRLDVVMKVLDPVRKFVTLG